MCVFLFDEKAFGLTAGMGSRLSVSESPVFVFLMLIVPDKLKKLNFARIACLKPFGEKGGKKGWRRGKRLFRCNYPVPLSCFPGTSPSRGRSSWPPAGTSSPRGRSSWGIRTVTIGD